MIARTPSESRLHNLHLDFTSSNASCGATAGTSSYITDDELEGLLFPSLGKSVLEEEDDKFALLAHKALQHLTAPTKDVASPGGGAVFSPYTTRSPVPDYHGGDTGDDNPYFLMSRKLYHDGASAAWTPAARSASSSSSSSSAGDSYSCESTSSGTWSPPLPSLTVDTLAATTNSLAARRGRDRSLKLASDNGAERRPPMAARSVSRGVLSSNFGGEHLLPKVSKIAALQDDDEVLEGPLSPMLRTKPRTTGFAF